MIRIEKFWSLRFENSQKIFCQKLIDFEGFRPNGYHHVNQRIFLHRVQWGIIDLDDFFENLEK